MLNNHVYGTTVSLGGTKDQWKKKKSSDRSVRKLLVESVHSEMCERVGANQEGLVNVI